MPTKPKAQTDAAVEALKIARGERTMDNASVMARQLLAQFDVAFIRTVARGEFKEILELKPLPVVSPPKVDNIPIVEEILDPPKAPEPEKKVVKGKKKVTRATKDTKKVTRDSKVEDA